MINQTVGSKRERHEKTDSHREDTSGNRTLEQKPQVSETENLICNSGEEKRGPVISAWNGHGREDSKARIKYWKVKIPLIHRQELCNMVRFAESDLPRCVWSQVMNLNLLE